jgi:hypothetical protein
MFAGLVLAAAAGAALLVPGVAVADETPTPTASASGPESDPTKAGTSFRTATALKQEQSGTAEAATGDYLYWVFPADTGQRLTAKATVALPEAALRHGASTWQIDVYDGLRRRQACQYGAQTRSAGVDKETVELSCVLRTVRSWSEPWADDPLPGSYYLRLTVVGLPAEDLGLGFKATVGTAVKQIGGPSAVDGSLAKPLGVSDAGATAVSPEDGWSGGWWSSRWVWTGIGAMLAALAGIWGYTLTRGTGRPARVPAAPPAAPVYSGAPGPGPYGP